MEVVDVANKYRITIKRSIRKVAVVPFGDKILVQPLPKKPEEKLAELTKDLIFDREARKKCLGS